MESKFETFADVIASWARASDLGDDIGVSEIVVRAWRKRGIPGAHWSAVAEAAARRGFDGITLQLLAHLGAKRTPDIRDADARPGEAAA